MRIPSTPRRTGARTKPIHFQYVPTEKGQSWEGYIAGPTWWGPLHMTRPSKPCVWEVSGHAIPCRFCGGTRPVAVMKGWVPIYRRVDAQACCVPVDESLRDVVDALPLFCRVTVGRAKGKGAGVWVQASSVQEPKWQTSLEERKRAADVTESLLVMWDVAELTTHFATLPSDNALSLIADRPTESARERAADAHKPDAQPYTAPGDDAMMRGTDAAVNRLKEHAAKWDQKPSANGKPKGEG